MGACFSRESDEDRVSARIDKEIGEDLRRLRRECKILLLGKEIWWYLSYLLISNVVFRFG